MFSFYISLDKRKNVLLGSFTYLICSEGTGEGILPRSLHLAGPCHCHLTLSRALYQVSSPSRVPQVVSSGADMQIEDNCKACSPILIPCEFQLKGTERKSSPREWSILLQPLEILIWCSKLSFPTITAWNICSLRQSPNYRTRSLCSGSGSTHNP